MGIYYYGNEAIKFLLKIKGHELVLQKKLLYKTNPWGIVSGTFEFKKEDAAYTLLNIYKILGERLGHIKVSHDPQKRNRD